MAKPDQQQLLQDLTEVAGADGVVTGAERDFVTFVAQSFQLPISL